MAQAQSQSQGPARARGASVLIGGVITSVFSVAPLIWGARLSTRHHAWKPSPPDQCELLCLDLNHEPIFRATGMLAFRGMTLVAGLTMIGVGAYLLTVKPTVQRTALGTWTTGFSLRS